MPLCTVRNAVPRENGTELRASAFPGPPSKKNRPPANESGPVVECGLVKYILSREGGFDNDHE